MGMSRISALASVKYLEHKLCLESVALLKHNYKNGQSTSYS